MGKILIVDDSDMFRDELKLALKNGEHEVLEASDGLDGLNKAKESSGIDIIISDFNMPELNGLQMVAMIKELEQYKTTPIFILTTETSPELKQQATTAGVMAWIVKPFVEKKLLMGISKILSMKAS
ncbi:MAG: response regulator [Pseudobacteriovorax sp.]|nr:response regulator [Pseudobacteriovorax sp.]